MSDIIVSDHAVLRWLERVEGYDIDRLRKDIAASALIGIRHGAGSVVVGIGKLVIRDGAVVTVLRRHHMRRDLIGVIEVDLVNREIAARRRPVKRRR